MAHRTQHLRLASVMQKTAWLLLHRPVHRGNPRGGGGGRGAAEGWGWGCGGRFSNNYIELRWWWVAMVTAVPSVSYD